LKVADSKDMLLFPLVSAGNVHGVVSILCRYEQKQDFEDAGISVAQSIIDAVSPVFSNLVYMDQLEMMVEQRTSALYAANKRVNSVIDSITDGFFVLNKNWEYVYLNPHQFVPGGKKPAEILGKNVWETYPEMV